MFVWAPLYKNEHFNILFNSLVDTFSENLTKYIDLLKEKVPKYVEPSKKQD